MFTCSMMLVLGQVSTQRYEEDSSCLCTPSCFCFLVLWVSWSMRKQQHFLVSLRFPCAWHRLDWPSKAVGHSGVLSDFLQACLTFCIFPFPDYPDPDNFTWEKYLKETGASAVPAWAFKVVSVTSSTPPYLGRNLGFLHCQVFAFVTSPVMFCILLPKEEILGFGPTLKSLEVRAILDK